MSIDPFLPSRILMTTDTIGGVWQYSLDLAQALGAHGIEVDLATLGRPLSTAQWESVSAIPNITVHESSFRLEWMNDPWEDIEAAGVWLQELAQEHYPDLIHFNHFAHAHLEWLQPTLVVVHSDVSSWWRNVKHEELPASWSRYQERVRESLQAADVVVAPTRTMMGSARSDYGPFKRERLIPNGRDSAFFQPKTKQPYILTVGRLWDPAKNIQILNTVAPQIEWPIYAAGEILHPDGGEPSAPHLKLLGQLAPDTLNEYLAGASIFAAPAKYEPFGLAILEAALSGCALILGDIPSLRENWEGAAIFVTPDDEASWIAAFESLLSNPDRIEDLGRLARERGKTFSMKTTTTLYLKEYRHLLQTQLPLSQDQSFTRKRSPLVGIDPRTKQ